MVFFVCFFKFWKRGFYFDHVCGVFSPDLFGFFLLLFPLFSWALSALDPCQNLNTFCVRNPLKIVERHRKSRNSNQLHAYAFWATPVVCSWLCGPAGKFSRIHPGVSVSFSNLHLFLSFAFHTYLLTLPLLFNLYSFTLWLAFLSSDCCRFIFKPSLNVEMHHTQSIFPTVSPVFSFSKQKSPLPYFRSHSVVAVRAT